jgi:MFS transporter, CP family, cyanate transporter
VHAPLGRVAVRRRWDEHGDARADDPDHHDEPQRVEPDGAVAPPVPGRRSAGPGLLAAVVLFGLNLRTAVASLPPLLETVRADLGLSATAAGVLTALPVLCFGAFAPLVPRLARRYGIERLLALCALATAAALALRGAGGVVALFAGTLLAGAGVAIAQTALPVLIRTGHARWAGQLTGAFSMALPLGATLAAALAVPFERALGSWEASLAAWSLLALGAGLLWLPRGGAGTRVTGPLAAPLRRDRLAWAVALYFAIQSMAFYIGLSWLPSILADAGYAEATAGFLQALSSVVQLAPAFLVPVLATRMGSQEPILAAIVALSSLAVIGLMLADGVAALWMVVLGLGQGGALGLALILPVLRGGEPRSVATLTAMTLSVGYLAAALGPWLAGVLHDVTGGWSATLVLLLAVTVLQGVPGLPAARDRQLRQAASDQKV